MHGAGQDGAGGERGSAVLQELRVYVRVRARHVGIDRAHVRVHVHHNNYSMFCMCVRREFCMSRARSFACTAALGVGVDMGAATARAVSSFVVWQQRREGDDQHVGACPRLEGRRAERGDQVPKILKFLGAAMCQAPKLFLASDVEATVERVAAGSHAWAALGVEGRLRHLHTVSYTHLTLPTTLSV